MCEISVLDTLAVIRLQDGTGGEDANLPVCNGKRV